MALIELRIPRKRLKNVNVLRSEALLDLERQKQHELEIKLFREEERRRQRMLEEQRRLEEEEERRRQLERAELLARRPIFTEEYTISDKNQPLDISLSNVYELSLPIEEMRKEIQSAYDKGFKDGCDTTQATMTVELMKQQEWLRNFDLITQDLREQFSKVLSDLEDSVSTLSIIAAQHILSHEVTANSQIVVEQTKKAIATLDNDEIFKIRLHPDDVEILKEAKSRLVSDRTRMDKVVLASDESVEPGGCILETSAGIVDARLTTQLETIKQSLLTVAKQPSAKEEAINEISNMQNPAEE